MLEIISAFSECENKCNEDAFGYSNEYMVVIGVAIDLESFI